MKYRIPTQSDLRNEVQSAFLASKLTQADFAARVGMTLSGFQKYLAGRRGASLELARQLAARI